jgi:uncharacterized protein
MNDDGNFHVMALQSRFERDVNAGEQEVLNRLGVNCCAISVDASISCEGRTVSSDPKWKYVNVRRYMNYLEASIDRGTQWAVFESNDERFAANFRETVSAFLTTSGSMEKPFSCGAIAAR